jgi:CBS domain-containing protein
MRPALTTVEANAHLAAAAYLMKRAGEMALVVVDDERARRPIGLITDANITQAEADGKDVNEIRIHDLMTADPTVITATTSIHKAARVMLTRRFRHLPLVGETDTDSAAPAAELRDEKTRTSADADADADADHSLADGLPPAAL